MDCFSYTRRLVHALLLLGTVNAGCATASLADGEKTQTPLTSTPAASQAVVDASATTQPQTDQGASKQSSESVDNTPPAQPQTDQIAPNQSEAEEVAPARP